MTCPYPYFRYAKVHLMAPVPHSNASTEWAFGPFTLSPLNRTLSNDGNPVQLVGRSFDLLLALVERAGEVVGNDELIARVWPSTIVEENNLRVQISTLRKVLRGGDRYIENIVGRGYSFVMPVTHLDPLAKVSRSDGVAKPLRPRLVGRHEAVAQLTEFVRQQRCLTVVGPGGMGKTAIAHAVMEAVSPTFGAEVYFLDLAPITDGALIASTLAIALGAPVLDGDALPVLLAKLQERTALIVFDSCEHVVDRVAELVEQLLSGGSDLHVFATSREPLRATGECVYRLAPLAVPAAPVTREIALSYSAVQLFMERAFANVDHAGIPDEDVFHVVDISRRLDGIPLAIELAAGRAEFFGTAGLAAQLEDYFNTLVRGRRTATPRHQTLRATLDWSFDMLPCEEQTLLARCSIFRGSFTLDAAVEIIACGRIDRPAVLAGLANLHAKSLINTVSIKNGMQYRLLDTTRAYATEKLTMHGTNDVVARRYAEYSLRFLGNAQADWEALPASAWLARYGSCIEHVRAGLDWAFGPAGDVVTGVMLTVISAPLWFQLSLMSEYRARLDRALSSATAHADGRRWTMMLNLALGHVLLHALGTDDGGACSAAFRTALYLADQLGDRACHMRALYGACTEAIFRGNYAAALDFAEKYGVSAERDGNEAENMIHVHLMSLTLLYLGQHNAAVQYVDRMIGHLLPHAPRTQNNGLQFDQRISSLAIQAGVLWMRGYPDQALSVVATAVKEGQELAHGISLSLALTAACAIATWCGAKEALRSYVDALLAVSTSGELPNWVFWGRVYRSVWLLEYSPNDPGLESLAAIESSPYCRPLQIDTMALAHPGLLTARAIERASQARAGWCHPEVLRHEAAAAINEARPLVAEAKLQRALAIARQQGARGLELRVAHSLALLWHSQQRGPEALELLQSAYDTFTEGHGTRDLLSAAALLGTLRAPMS